MAKRFAVWLAAASLAACFGAAPARAWWVYGPRVAIVPPPVVVGPPIVYGAPVYGPPVVYAPPPVIYAPRPPYVYAAPPRVWVPGGYVHGVWIPPHWS